MLHRSSDVRPSALAASNNDARIATSVATAVAPSSADTPTGRGLAGGSAAVQLVSSPEPLAAVQKLSGTTIALIMAPLCLSVMLSALDLTIVTPAIPAIAGSFESVAGYIWVGSAFVLANTASTPVWGSVADIWGRKPIMLIAVAVFLAGSLLCALAPHMDVLIAGRVIQGIGASGMGAMVNVIIYDTFLLRDRELYLAITSIVWAVGSGVGPVLGGVFTTRLEWV
ncbi:multidrug resistance protein fnx1 [Glonium stellatum]|uniref:Multidrug resistance protein fnx1 n=1 Tax=Glonium stellatum TaxID=574774 RepID=A0A8E2F3Y2_9PEZI|nr:multidrug resistance protein fnx1 [Glonium stellatum]